MPLRQYAPSDMMSVNSYPLSRQSSTSDYSTMTNTPAAQMDTDFDLPTPVDEYGTYAFSSAIPEPSGAIPRTSSRLTTVTEVEEGVSQYRGSPVSVASARMRSFSPPPRTPERPSSAAELIRRYESLATPPPRQDSFHSIHTGRPLGDRSLTAIRSEGWHGNPQPDPVSSHLPLPPSPKKPKKQSPIRRSFRNLMSVINKMGKRGSHIAEPPPIPAPQFVPPPPPKEVEVRPPPRNEPSTSSVPSRRMIRTGNLWYFASPTQVDGPAGAHCSVELLPGHLLVTASGPTELLIPLANCDDVRSLDPRRDDLSALQNRSGVPHLLFFELCLVIDERPSREVFGASSVQDRANWISAIWDAVLQPRTPGCSYDAGDHNVHMLGLDSASSAFVKRHQPSHDAFEAEESSEDRDLPPIPQTPLESHPSASEARSNYDMPSVLPEDRPSLYVDSPSRSARPSVRNLGELSMVKKRLADLQRAKSAPVPPPKSIPPIQRSHTLAAQPTPMERQASSASDVADAIVDSYASSAYNSPMQRSGQMCGDRGIYEAADPGFLHAIDEDAVVEAFDAPRSLEVAHDQVARWASQEADLKEQLSGLRQEVRGMMTELGTATTGIKETAAEDTRHLLQFVGDLLSRVESVVGTIGDTHQTQMTLGNIQGGLRGVAEMSSSLCQGTSEVAEKVDQLQTKWNTDMPNILHNIRSLLDKQSMAAPADGTSSDISAVHAKLDALLTQKILPLPPSQAGNGVNPSELEFQEVLNLLRADQQFKISQFDQQKDSARYLAELNAWLESFVNGGISQIQGLAANVQQISEQLGLETTPDQAGAPNSGQPNPVIARVQGQAAIQASLDGLSALVAEDLQDSANARNWFVKEGERQREQQEKMLRDLAGELKAEIKGERLRFVDAMKEATAINVGIHVEQFKKELTREVLSMTQEVNRLQTERQALEQQIAELFAFYARRQQAGAVTGQFPLARSRSELPRVASLSYGHKKVPAASDSQGQFAQLPGTLPSSTSVQQQMHPYARAGQQPFPPPNR